MSKDLPPTIHGTAVALDGCAALLLGASGRGKSDLALRLIDAGWVLVADDRVILSRRGNRLLASAPAPIAGLIEARGLGLCRVPYLPEAEVVLAVDLAAPEAAERLPESASRSFEGIDIPLIKLCSFEISAVSKLRLALGGAVVR